MSDNFDEVNKYISKFEKLVPELNDTWTGFRDEVFKEGLISAKDKQLIALACAYITESAHDIKERTIKSKELGATDEQIAESVYIAMRLAIGQPYAFSSIALENFDLMKSKESVFKGYFISKNITPQIQDFHKVSGSMHEKFNAFHEIVYEDGHLPKKLKKGLMGLACAILAKCPWCIRSCVRDGLQEGVVKEEIVEAINIAMVMNASACVANTGKSMKAAEEFSS
ncbi:MAG: carboxymuconolactone decarboxylase family protein [Promethearchaeota archaeon]|jgi:AhpD family alkylhydroperoxidase